MDLILFELKKIFSQKINWLILFLTLFLPLIIFFQQINQTSSYATYLKEDGTPMTQEEIEAEIDAFNEKWTGEMNEQWWQEFQKANKEATYYTNLPFIDEQKMIDAYGNDWFEMFYTDRESFADLDENGEIEQGKKLIYRRENPLPFTKDLLYHFEVKRLYMNYAGMMLKDKPWNSEDGTYGEMYESVSHEKVSKYVYSRINMTEEELIFLKDYMNEKDCFHYGDSKGWIHILNTISSMGIFIVIWVIMISSQMMNKERDGMIEMLSSTAYGRGRLFISKVLASFSAGLFGLVFNIAILMLVALLTNQIGDSRVNVSEGLNMVSIFTYGESFWISLFIIGIGILSISMIGVLFSTFIKSSYVSLGITTIMIVGLNLLSPMSILFPMSYMSVDASVFRNFTISIFNHAFLLWKLIPIIWIPIILMLFVVCYIKFNSKKYQRI